MGFDERGNPSLPPEAVSLEPDPREQTIRDRSDWAQEWQSGFVLFSGAEVGHLLRVIDGLRAEAVQPATVGEAARLILNSGLEVEPHVHAWLVTLADQP